MGPLLSQFRTAKIRGKSWCRSKRQQAMTSWLAKQNKIDTHNPWKRDQKVKAKSKITTVPFSLPGHWWSWPKIFGTSSQQWFLCQDVVERACAADRTMERGWGSHGQLYGTPLAAAGTRLRLVWLPGRVLRTLTSTTRQVRRRSLERLRSTQKGLRPSSNCNEKVNGPNELKLMRICN